jgi:hypothetical protein
MLARIISFEILFLAAGCILLGGIAHWFWKMSLCKAGSRFAARLLLISGLAAALVGCSSSASQQTHWGFEYADRGLYRTHYEQSSQVHSQHRVLHGSTITAKKTNARHRKNNNSTKIAEPHNAPKMDASSFIRPDDKPNVVITTPGSAPKTEIPHDEETKTEITNDEAIKTEIPPSSQLDDESVIIKAKATIAAKMTDRDSVKFEEMERAVRKNALGKSIDTICGFVRDKNSGPRPFLYLVLKDEAYIGGYTIAASEYRNVCSITTLPDR